MHTILDIKSNSSQMYRLRFWHKCNVNDRIQPQTLPVQQTTTTAELNNTNKIYINIYIIPIPRARIRGREKGGGPQTIPRCEPEVL